MKINHLFSALMGATIILIASCNKSHQVIPDAIPVQIDGEETWSLMTLDGKIIAENEFEGNLSSVYNGRFVAYDRGYYVYDIDKPSKALNDEPFDQLTCFFTGYAYGTRPGTGILIVDTNGEVVKELPNDILDVTIKYDGDANLIAFSDCSHNYGFMTPDGQIKIQPTWKEVKAFSEGKAMVKNKDDRWICIDKSGEELFKLRKNESPNGNFTNGWLAVEGNERHKFVDSKGEEIVKFKSGQRISSYGSNNRVLIYDAEDNECILMKDVDVDKGEKVKKFSDAYMLGTDGTRFLTRKSSDSDWIIVDENGENVGESRFENQSSSLAEFGIILGGESDEYCYQPFDINGKKINNNIEISQVFYDQMAWRFENHYDFAVSHTAYNKELVKETLSVIGNTNQFGGAEGVPAISKNTSAKKACSDAGFESAKSALNNINGYGLYYFNKESKIPDNWENSYVDYYVAFAKRPVTSSYIGWWSWEKYYNYTDATPSLCAIELEVSKYVQDVTVTAIIEQLKAKGWQPIAEHENELKADNGNHIYIIPYLSFNGGPEYYGITIIYAFHKLDYDNLYNAAQNCTTQELFMYNADIFK